MKFIFSFSKIIFLGVLIAPFCSMNAQSKKDNPKLVVGIVVDQMRYDYLYRFYDQYSEGGFKRLLNQGFSCENTHYNYTPTNTAPGHASIFTGSTPTLHGIINNNWYSREKGRRVYCSEDNTVEGVGTNNGNEKERMSPRNLKTSTITDELRLASQLKSKVIGISIKDRSAIFPAGHIPNGAYWHDRTSGKMISSTYYFDELPEWVKSFNAKKLPDAYMKEGWKPLLPLEKYSASLPDQNDYEASPTKEKKAVFPYFIEQFDNENKYKQFPATALANSFLKDFAQEAILAEKLGKDSITDFLTLSFSSTDYVGHRYGIYSVEIQDTYLRLDRELAELFMFLDENVGEGEYTLFLTADHAGAPTPSHLKDLKFDADYLNWNVIKTNLNSYLSKVYGEGDYISYLSDQDVYLNRKLLIEKGLDLVEIQNKTSQFLLTQKGITQTFTATELSKNIQRTGYTQLIQNGYNQRLSPDVVFIFQSGYMDSYYENGGTTHGTPYTYDTQVPLLFYGKHIPTGKTYRRVNITDIAPSIAAILKLQQPSGSTGAPIVELFED